jgi:hypothetical protein
MTTLWLQRYLSTPVNSDWCRFRKRKKTLLICRWLQLHCKNEHVELLAFLFVGVGIDHCEIHLKAAVEHMFAWTPHTKRCKCATKQQAQRGLRRQHPSLSAAWTHIVILRFSERAQTMLHDWKQKLSFRMVRPKHNTRIIAAVQPTSRDAFSFEDFTLFTPH